VLHGRERQKRVDLVDVKSSLGIIGAGRLAEGLAKTWLARTGKAPVIWSRSGQSGGAVNRISEATWVNRWTGTLEAQSVAIAIPGRALLDLVEGTEQARQFKGNVFSAAASLSRSSLQRLFPQATIVGIAPFLIDDENSIPMLVLRPSELSDSAWSKVQAELDHFGDCDVIEDEAVFNQLSLLGSSWPAVVLAAVNAAAGAGVDQLQDNAAIRLGRRIFFRGLHSLLATCAQKVEHKPASDIATPGGITERGFQSLGNVNSLFESVFKQMQTRAEELRA
jgi:pyrroline-5-carboxylate reductase